MKKLLCIFVCVFLAVPVILYSQTAQKIEELLNTEALSNEQVAWLVLEAADISEAEGILNEADAFNYAAELQWFPNNAESNAKARLDKVSALIMQAFNMKGGLFYTITKGSHYAYRELVYRNVIVGRTDPQMDVSGYRLLFMVNRVLSYQEAGQL